MKHTARQIAEWEAHQQKGDAWIPARPINFRYEGWLVRLSLAWGVLTGRYDALDWEDR